ncbi:NADH-quinone oxidoreductase subunit H [Kineococcus sp. SYSU DK004]|uniref:NADH-quinone oxidoreductase subunit H n=1 Tax=Kineococcus sp. SYSU DK004 TaxID=3383125 RepID=UPI003D7D67E1
MGDPVAVVQASPLWALAVVPGLLLLAAAGAAVASALDARGARSAGPAGPAGPAVAAALAAPAAEAARLLRQRRRTTVAADRPLWRAGVGGPLVAACLMVAVVPLGGWTLADLGVGIVWVNAVDVLLWALVWLAGWGPNSLPALVGGYRFLAQALAHELPLMFALTAPAVAAGSLRLADVVAAQGDRWFVLEMPVAFALFCAGVLAFSARGPFAHPFGLDVAGGPLAELSGVDRLLLLAGRHALLAAGAAVAVTLFLGGGAGPVLPAPVWVAVKTFLLLLGLHVLARAVPLLRADRLTELGWVVALPLALLQLLVTSISVLG